MSAAPAKEEVLGLPLSSSVTIDVMLDLCERHLSAERDRALTVTFVNPHAWTQVERHADYLELLHKTDVVLADGIGVALAATHLNRRRTPRISFDFSSLAGPLLERCALRGWPVGLVGSHQGVAGRVAARIRGRYPSLKIVDCGDGYRSFEEISRRVCDAQVDIVAVGMGVPHQERLLHRLASCHAGVLFTCGGFLDQTQRSLEYYPWWVDRLNLRFAYRLAMEPRRLGRRYLVEYLPFVRSYARGAIQAVVRA